LHTLLRLLTQMTFSFYKTSTTWGPNGLFTTTFNGLVVNCSSDSDCPGPSLCAVNNPRASYPAMCVCRTGLGLQGENCSELSTYGLAGLGLAILVSVISTLTLLISCASCARLFKLREVSGNGLNTTLLLSILSSISTFVYSVSIEEQLLHPSQGIIYVTVVGQSQKQQVAYSVEVIAVALAYLFATGTGLNISLLWIAVASNAQRLSKKYANNVQQYRKVLAGE